MVRDASRISFAAVTGVLALGLSACTGEAPPPAAEDQTNHTTVPDLTEDEVTEYVALGDSYAAMGSISAPAEDAEICLRSTDNYPAVVSADLQLTGGTDTSCAGATIPDLLQPSQAGEVQLPAQIEALSPETDLITLSIGGNDLGFGEIAGCVQTAVHSGTATDCATELDGLIQQRLTRLPAELDEVYAAIDDRAGGAAVITTGYLPLVTGAANCPEAELVSQPDRSWAEEITAQLNDAVREAAERHGATFVLPAEVEQHTACADPSQRWADITGEQTDSFPMHPTAAGQAAMGRAVLSQID